MKSSFHRSMTTQQRTMPLDMILTVQWQLHVDADGHSQTGLQGARQIG